MATPNNSPTDVSSKTKQAPKRRVKKNPAFKPPLLRKEDLIPSDEDSPKAHFTSPTPEHHVPKEEGQYDARHN